MIAYVKRLVALGIPEKTAICVAQYFEREKKLHALDKFIEKVEAA